MMSLKALLVNYYIMELVSNILINFFTFYLKLIPLCNSLVVNFQSHHLIKYPFLLQ